MGCLHRWLPAAHVWRDSLAGDCTYTLLQQYPWTIIIIQTISLSASTEIEILCLKVYFQRVLASKTPRGAQILSLLGGVGCLLFAIPPIIIGAIGYATGKLM